MTPPREITVVSILMVALCLTIIVNCQVGGLTSTQIDIGNIALFPQKIEIDGREFVLTASVWRDFMPISPPDGKPLIVSIRVMAVDSLEIPQSLDVDMLWVINGGDIWSAELAGEPRRDWPFLFYKGANDGPKWGPGIYVDIIARLVNEDSSYHLRVSDVYIGATY